MGHAVTIHLIRHEKTKANEEKKYIGWSDESIIVKGATFEMPIQIEKIYGSDLRRCIETARLYFPNAHYHTYPQLRELNFGNFEMKTYEQLKGNPVYRSWIDSPETITPTNGESFNDFKKRVLGALHQIINVPGEYAFVTHGGVIRLLLSLFSPSKKSFQQINVKHREIATLSWSQLADWKGERRCELLSVEPIMEKGSI